MSSMNPKLKSVLVLNQQLACRFYYREVKGGREEEGRLGDGQELGGEDASRYQKELNKSKARNKENSWCHTKEQENEVK